MGQLLKRLYQANGLLVCYTRRLTCFVGVQSWRCPRVVFWLEQINGLRCAG